MKKALVSLIVLLSFILIPNVSLSKDSDLATITVNENNLLVLNDEVSGDSVGAVMLKAKQLDAKLSDSRESITGVKKPLYLVLNTPGGSILSGLQLIEFLKGLGRPVHTITLFAASMGWQIAQNLSTRYILKSGVLMSHHAAGQFQGQFGGAAPSQLDSRVRVWTQITKELDETTVKRTKGKQTLVSYQKAYDPELWVTGQEAVLQGYADDVTLLKCDKSITGTTPHRAMFMGIPIDYELDNCPLNTSPLNVHIGSLLGMTKEYSDYIKEEFLSKYSMKMHSYLPMVL